MVSPGFFPRALAVVAAWGLFATTFGPGPADAAQGLPSNPTLRVAPVPLTTGAARTVTVTGTDYLVPGHAPGASVFGGVYLFFGWVRPTGGWGPSIRNSNNNDGNYGVTYHYPGDGGDAGTRDDPTNQMKFVSFTERDAGGPPRADYMDDDGNWSVTLTIKGPSYTWLDGAGQAHAVNCRQVQCGVFTIGAHGKASATNEKFTPIAFVDPASPTTKAPTNNRRGGNDNGGATGATGGPTATDPPLAGGIPNTGATTPTATGATGPTTTVSPEAKARAKAKKKSTTATTTAPSADGDDTTETPVAVAKLADTDTDTDSDNGSSPGPAIGVSALVVLLVAGGLGWFFVRRRAAA